MTEGGPSPGIAAPVAGLGLAVDVARHGGDWLQSGITDASVERAARAALAAAPEPLSGDYEVTVVLTDDAEMRGLNRTWRGKDASTNVLSFPSGDTPRGPFLGDIVLAYETTLKESREGNVAFADHVSHLVVHGMVHLLGFDHLSDSEAERMEAIERRALAALGIADPYADRETSLSELSS